MSKMAILVLAEIHISMAFFLYDTYLGSYIPRKGLLKEDFRLKDAGFKCIFYKSLCKKTQVILVKPGVCPQPAVSRL